MKRRDFLKGAMAAPVAVAAKDVEVEEPPCHVDAEYLSLADWPTGLVYIKTERHRRKIKARIVHTENVPKREQDGTLAECSVCRSPIWVHEPYEFTTEGIISKPGEVTRAGEWLAVPVAGYECYIRIYDGPLAHQVSAQDIRWDDDGFGEFVI